jgi:hypothetical protein
MIKLTRIVESTGAEGQYYDLGRDFAAFRRMIDGADQQIRSQYEQQIGKQLVGKRIRARASRGYKQYVKDYEFDVARITVDDYYDNFVVVAHDSSTPKAKEYFLKPGFKIQVLGPATGQPSPQKGGRPDSLKSPAELQAQQPAAQPQQMTPAAAAAPSQSEPPAAVKETKKESGYYDAYSIDAIGQDIKEWLPRILQKPETAIRDFVKGLGWQKALGNGTSVALFDLKVPVNAVKKDVPTASIRKMVSDSSKDGSTIQTKYEVVKMEPDDKQGIWHIRIKKTMTDKSV